MRDKAWSRLSCSFSSGSDDSWVGCSSVNSGFSFGQADVDFSKFFFLPKLDFASGCEEEDDYEGSDAVEPFQSGCDCGEWDWFFAPGDGEDFFI